MILVFYFKSKQNTFVQFNTTQVYLLSLNALYACYMFRLYTKTVNIRRGTYILLYLPVYVLVEICLNIAYV